MARAPLIALALAALRPATAHGLWIEPTAFVTETGQIVGTRLRVGVDLVGEPLPRHASPIESFVPVDKAGRQPLPSRERADPAGVLRARVPGVSAIGCHSRPSRLELPADKFGACCSKKVSTAPWRCAMAAAPPTRARASSSSAAPRAC